MYCKHCFRQLSDGARFCKYCGQPVTAQPQAGQNQPGRRQPRQGYPRQGRGQPVAAQPQAGQNQPGRRQPRQGYPQQSRGQQGYVQQPQADRAGESAPPKKAPSLFAQVKAGVMDIIRHPAKLLPTIILSVIWMAISYLMAMGKDTAVVKWLNTLTYASGGMYGGSVGAAGGIFGKAVFAAVLNTIVLSLWAGKNPFARDENGQSLMRKATGKGMSKVAPFFIGLGVSFVLYYFFNVTSSTKNVMVGVMAAIGTVQAAQSSHGIIFSTVLFIIEKVSGGRSPSSSAVRNSLMGATAGFALSVPLTFLHQPLLLAAAGSAVLMLGILLAVLGQQKKPAQA